MHSGLDYEHFGENRIFQARSVQRDYTFILLIYTVQPISFGPANKHVKRNEVLVKHVSIINLLLKLHIGMHY